MAEHVPEVERVSSTGASPTAWRCRCSCGWEGALQQRASIAQADGLLTCTENLSGVIDNWLFAMLCGLPDDARLHRRLRTLIPSTADTAAGRAREYERRDTLVAWMWDSLELVAFAVPVPLRAYWSAMCRRREHEAVAVARDLLDHWLDSALDDGTEEADDKRWTSVEHILECIDELLTLVQRDDGISAEAVALVAESSAAMSRDAADRASDEAAEAWRAMEAEVADGDSPPGKRSLWLDEVDDDAIIASQDAMEAEDTAHYLATTVTSNAENVAGLAADAVCTASSLLSDDDLFWIAIDPVSLLHRLAR